MYKPVQLGRKVAITIKKTVKSIFWSINIVVSAWSRALNWPLQSSKFNRKWLPGWILSCLDLNWKWKFSKPKSETKLKLSLSGSNDASEIMTETDKGLGRKIRTETWELKHGHGTWRLILSISQNSRSCCYAC